MQPDGAYVREKTRQNRLGMQQVTQTWGRGLLRLMTGELCNQLDTWLIANSRQHECACSMATDAVLQGQAGSADGCGGNMATLRFTHKASLQKACGL